ncbi:bifunctional tRNA (5-methylaminomethyl-2-thiouridine)(34)-methyltransferase MnmD/FAD-dependent 5-carboxymethylaminomethyl-2-thiouridine(34) oxidoreductase MnmC [Shewanella sp. Choline-02u-19]|uniref:FAD-dependent 5-carboxymethylaminomethyl-2-thiouridine(34) oxidoreductase MnmC n=1 Tax=unclassified Shewanella TaxID=196818 RepID=UPI000C32D788|nr:MULTISPECIES: FAD-dependent 5-carboxymethylaminomethyl-2-thiouridine(34) oxidoreductase MnmC [unclassified Shewanella]PKH56483.1 bifunctional tRNA (5-methylaminomethyl-2-thiouridine)(34)-methyltransferase MnmD/FAD-dependent 5-carboxymethylaminomethyl-2-thiouridine(34) oxidoreductase MnmC [Shewanella sp. Bg11-22]PKI28011.1 bifunctional tRNA (5-methylaminomethyl-2-thiouridine)(34)-methyltransferase MnmD/FAD-dependent 5-carboxymethylaminomethyl-2-thiouridine(34) oxidoreductase MnmC [Shewanella sp
MTVSKIIQSILAIKNTKDAVIAILGLDSVSTITDLIEYQSASKSRLTVKIFCAIDEHIEQLFASQACRDLLQTRPETQLVAIEGCQRVKLNQGALIIDFHLGHYEQQLRQISVSSTHLIAHWICAAAINLHSIEETLFWQMAKHSNDSCDCLISDKLPVDIQQELYKLSQLVGFNGLNSSNTDNVPLMERQALRAQQLSQQAPYPIHAVNSADEIAVIGGGIACASLVLSLAERKQKTAVFCEDSDLAQAASGNRQGAIYPLLTPDNNTLSQYFQQAYLFSLHRLASLSNQNHAIDFDLCGVLHTGHDERSRKRVLKIVNGHHWCVNIAHAVTAQQSSELAGIDIDETGIFYPLGGWVAPQDLCRASLEQASRLSDVSIHLNTQITALEKSDAGWFLVSNKQRLGPYKTVVVANGKSLTRFEQTKHLQVTGFRGQVSHAPTRAKLSKLSTVLCANGYMTPMNDALHCLGASYIKDAANLDYSPQEQVDNLHKIQQSYLNKDWNRDIDISKHSARVGVRMVTRDHAPMMGPVPDLEAIMALYDKHQLTPESRKFWQSNAAPVHNGLYLLGGLGSRGLSSGLLAAEALAAQICGEVMPISTDFIALLNPNRMWMRKLLKGKSVESGSE